MKVIGMISGTSFDAIDVAAARLQLDGKDLVLHPFGALTIPYEKGLQREIANILPPAHTTSGAMCRLDNRLGQAFARAAEKAARKLCGGSADLVVSHGQTVFHWVEDNRALGTLQLGEPAWIAENTGLPVVSDLRARDVAAGGHGAPLVSIFDALLLGGAAETRAALNLGGIANLTVIPASGEPFAFDIGPANALIDAAVAHRTGDAEVRDEDGRRAARGMIRKELLRLLLDEPYYDLDPPKSTGKERFNLSYLLERLEMVGEVGDDDLVATVTALTARTVARSLQRYAVKGVVASGGGVRNPTLMRMLRDSAPKTRLETIDHLGVPSDGKEAYAFAVLGFLTVHGLTGTVPGCTGARHASVLGSITPGRAPLTPPPPVEAGPSQLRIETP